MKDEHFFVQNPAHHRAIILLPFRIGFVTNGNHRIAQAIMQGKGTLTPYKVNDISHLLYEISFDGNYWIRQGKRIGKPRYAEFGWVWEAYKHFHDI